MARKKIFITIKLNDNEGILKFSSPQDVLEWVNLERDNWSWVAQAAQHPSVGRNLFIRRNNVYQIFPSMNQAWDQITTITNSVISSETINEDSKESVREVIENTINNKILIPSNSKSGRFYNRSI